MWRWINASDELSRDSTFIRTSCEFVTRQSQIFTVRRFQSSLVRRNSMRSPRERSPEPDDAPESSPPSDYSFWNPFSLTFPTRSKEDRYIKQNLDAWLTQDMFAHVLGCLPGPFYVYNLYSLLPLWYTILWLTLSLVYAPINIYIFCKHR